MYTGPISKRTPSQRHTIRLAAAEVLRRQIQTRESTKGAVRQARASAKGKAKDKPTINTLQISEPGQSRGSRTKRKGIHSDPEVEGGLAVTELQVVEPAVRKPKRGRHRGKDNPDGTPDAGTIDRGSVRETLA